MAFNKCGKVYHFTKASAENHADRLEVVTGARPHVYRCTVCGKWHVGYSPARASKMNKVGKQQRRKYHKHRRPRIA